MSDRVIDLGEGDASQRGAVLLAAFVAAGYHRVEPAILQPASLFLDQAGEDIRGRLYLTGDASGAEFCLRPEYTIPVGRAYLDSPERGYPAAFSYCGPVFRFRGAGNPEFIQAGIESLGRTDRDAADAEILTTALEGAETAGPTPAEIRIGDAGMFTAFLHALDLPEAWQRRIRRGHARGQTLDAILEGTNGRSGDPSGVLAALDGVGRRDARLLVEDLLQIAGIASVGGRTAGEIADRFLEQASLRSGGLPDDKRALLARFLAVAGDPDAAAATLRTLAAEAQLAIGPALDTFEARLNFMAARGLDLTRLHFAASFARNLDYYTGFVFEARNAAGRPVIGGGRYDGLLRSLGAPQDIPAVGASIWCDRLAGADT